MENKNNGKIASVDLCSYVARRAENVLGVDYVQLKVKLLSIRLEEEREMVAKDILKNITGKEKGRIPEVEIAMQMPFLIASNKSTEIPMTKAASEVYEYLAINSKSLGKYSRHGLLPVLDLMSRQR